MSFVLLGDGTCLTSSSSLEDSDTNIGGEKMPSHNMLCDISKQLTSMKESSLYAIISGGMSRCLNL
eukprot:9152007-Ditylum_brightwellii.AAC.1